MLIFVHPDEVCSLRDALTIPSQTESASEAASPSSGQATVTFSAKESEPDDKQQPTLVLAPLALMTVGWDMGGSPLSRTDTVQCALDILELPQVVRWFVSHHTGHYPPGSKVWNSNTCGGRLHGLERKKKYLAPNSAMCICQEALEYVGKTYGLWSLNSWTGQRDR